jgi:CO/xanthine dehydrogenase Mo-binding subunit
MGIKTAAMEQNDRLDGAFEPRLEDYRLLTGAGNFQDDEATAGAAWGVFVRSGDPVALVIAGSEAEARDAAELVEVDYAAPGAPQIWPEAPGNIAVGWHPYGAKYEDRAELDRVFAGAAHIASVRAARESAHRHGADGAARRRRRLRTRNRSLRTARRVAERQDVARAMSVSVDKLRVVSRDVGGAFGMRTSGYPEYPAMLVAAKMLGRPVRWRSTRQEGSSPITRRETPSSRAASRWTPTASRQDQGAAERRPRRYRPRTHRHRWARRRHRAGALDRTAAEIRRQVWQPQRKVPRGRGEDAA